MNMIPNIARYERMGTSYVAYDGSGKPVGILTSVKSINTAKRRNGGLNRRSGGLKG